MYRAPLDVRTLGYPSTSRPACAYVATGEIVCTGHRLRRGDLDMEPFDNNAPDDVAKHLAISIAAGALLLKLASDNAAAADALAVAQTMQAQAVKSFQQVTSPSMVAGIDGTPDDVAPGLVWYRYDQGYFNDDPTWFRSLTPSALKTTTGWVDLNQVGPGDATPNTLPVAQQNRFSLVLKGYFVPKVTGVHTFNLGSDDASYLWWGSDAAVMTADKSVRSASISLPGTHGVVMGSVSINMSAGTAYPLAIMYGQSGGGYNLRFTFMAPGAAETWDGTGYYFCKLLRNTVVASAVRGV